MGERTIDGVYHPPEGIYFRLYNHHKGYTIWASDGEKPWTGTAYKDTPPNSSQWWTLVHVKDNKYAFKNYKTEWFMQAHVWDNGWCDQARTPNEWCQVTILPPTHAKWEGYVKIIFHEPVERGSGRGDTSWMDYTGWLRCNEAGYWTPFWNPDKPQDYTTEVYWQMLYEDLQFEGIEWNTDQAVVHNEGIENLVDETYTNKTDVVSTWGLKYERSVSKTSEAFHHYGISLKFTWENTFKLPKDVYSNGVKIEIGGEIKFGWNQKDTTTETLEFKQDFACPAWTIHKAQMKVTTGRIEIPFKLNYKSPGNGVRVSTHGKWVCDHSWGVDRKIWLVEKLKKYDGIPSLDVSSLESESSRPPPEDNPRVIEAEREARESLISQGFTKSSETKDTGVPPKPEPDAPELPEKYEAGKAPH